MKHVSLIIIAFAALSLITAAQSLATQPFYRDSSNPTPQSVSKKGLQVELVDDAIALGIKHAALNVNLAQLISPNSDDAAAVHAYNRNGQSFQFSKRYVQSLDRQISKLSDNQITINLILLVYQSAHDDVNRLLLHPEYDQRAPNRLSAFNLKTEAGARWLDATIDFLAERYSGLHPKQGRVNGYIVGNEVNSHWWWANAGERSLEEFVDEYEQVVRTFAKIIAARNPEAKVYVSLEHHWNRAFQSQHPERCFGARQFLERFNELAKARGNFSWHVAFHPYPENLFDPRFWEDQSATFRFDTERVTFKNLEVLTEFLKQDRFLLDGKPRRVILSEQGFHTPDGPEGESIQAAAYCLAYRKVDQLPGIDAFILHRHVDHPREGGLRLGLRSFVPSAPDPRPPKRIYDCFKAAGTELENQAFQFAIPIVGQENWNDLLRPKTISSLAPQDR